MSSSAASFTAAPSIPGTHATLTARKAGCGIADVNAVSASSVDGDAPQSLNAHSASGEPLQSPGQKRPGPGIGPGPGGGTIEPGAIVVGSPSVISASQRAVPSSAAGVSSPVQPAAPTP